MYHLYSHTRLQHIRPTHLPASSPSRSRLDSPQILGYPNQSTTHTRNVTAPSSAVVLLREPPLLFASIMVRIWASDAFGMTVQHLHDWLSYMAFAGVSEVRVYDHCLHPSECLWLKAHAYAGLTIHHIPWHAVDTYRDAQLQAYADSIQHARRHRDAHRIWLMHLDVDEYPFSPIDAKPDFLLRYISQTDPRVAQVVMRSLFFGGPSDLVTAANTPLPIQYVHRQLEAEPLSQRTKYMARVRSIAHDTQDNLVHRLRIAPDERDSIPEQDVLRVNHYWGFRLGKPFATLVLDLSLHDLFQTQNGNVLFETANAMHMGKTMDV
jgi:hypothetical protein